MKKITTEHPVIAFAIYMIYCVMLVYGVMPYVMSTFGYMRFWSWFVVIAIFFVHAMIFVYVMYQNLMRKLKDIYGTDDIALSEALKNAKLPLKMKIRYMVYTVLFIVVFLGATYWVCKPEYRVKTMNFTEDGTYLRSGTFYYAKIDHLTIYVEETDEIKDSVATTYIDEFLWCLRDAEKYFGEDNQRDFELYLVKKPIFHEDWIEETYEENDSRLVLNMEHQDEDSGEFIYRLFQLPERWTAYGLLAAMDGKNYNSKKLYEFYQMEENLRYFELSNELFMETEYQEKEAMLKDTAMALFFYMENTRGISSVRDYVRGIGDGPSDEDRKACLQKIRSMRNGGEHE